MHSIIIIRVLRFQIAFLFAAFPPFCQFSSRGSSSFFFLFPFLSILLVAGRFQAERGEKKGEFGTGPFRSVSGRWATIVATCSRRLITSPLNPPHASQIAGAFWPRHGCDS